MSTIMRREAASASAGVGDDRRLKIKLDTRTRRLFIGDARLFGPDRRSLANRLVRELCARPGVRRAEIDVWTNTCFVDFDLGIESRRQMADMFVESLRAATSREDGRWWSASEHPWTSIVAYRHQGEVFLWQAFADVHGAPRLIHRRPWGSIRSARDLADEISGIEGVETCEIAFWSKRMTIQLDRAQGVSSVPVVMGYVQTLLEGRPRAASVRTRIHSGVESLVIATGWKRLALVALGGGALTMAIAGLVLPGVWTAAFLLAGSYCLARSWPSLEDRLQRAPVFGPMLHQSRLQGTSRRSLPSNTVAGLALVVVAMILVPFGPVAFLLIVLISSLGVYGLVPSSTAPGAGDEPEAPRLGHEFLPDRTFGYLAPPVGV